MKDRRVLVVDDDSAVATACVRILEAEGYEVEVAGGAVEAMEYLKKESFDLMLTDLKMPGSDGFVLAARARDLRPEMPILAMTGFMPEAMAAEVERFASGFISKPFTPDELTAEVNRIIGG